MAETKIEWTDATWNPVRGCTKIIARLVDEVVQLRAERDCALKEEQRSAFNMQKAAARILALEEELANDAENRKLVAEVERLRTVIRTGGAAYRLERAAMGIPGGLDPEGQPIAKTEGNEP